MRAVVIAGYNTAWHPSDVEIWMVTDEEYDIITENEGGYRFVHPSKAVIVEEVIDILFD
jgi:hypothetical protein